MTWYLTCSWLAFDDFGATWPSNRSQEGLEDVNLSQILVPGGSGGAPHELQAPLLHALEGSFEQK